MYLYPVYIVPWRPGNELSLFIRGEAVQKDLVHSNPMFLKAQAHGATQAPAMKATTWSINRLALSHSGFITKKT